MQVDIAMIHAAAERLAGIAVRTPLVQLRGDDRATDIWLKPEVLQPVGSFKIRGAFNAIARRAASGDLPEVSTLSAGNMSQGVAWSARRLGIPATAIMPEGAPSSKIDATEGYGASVEFIPRDQMFAAMNDGRFNSRPGFVHPFDDPDVVAGHGTIGLEILEDLPDIETVLVPVGSGGLLIGIATAIKATSPNAQVIGVQPEGASGFAVSFAAGEPETMSGSTFVDGAGAPFVMDAMFPALMEVADGCLTVSDDETRAAIRLLANKNKLIAEEPGLFPWPPLKLDPEERGKTVCIISGGSIDPADLAAIVREAEA
ncbi:MAG: threonine/serine dehydratase [Thermomicrobiales bacterium]